MAIYANNDKAKMRLGWNPERTLEEMMSTAWNWELKLKQDSSLHENSNFQMN
jgi:UDP-glucose 4-epimerase